VLVNVGDTTSDRFTIFAAEGGIEPEAFCSWLTDTFFGTADDAEEAFQKNNHHEQRQKKKKNTSDI
jgi:hypothetical protein